MLKHVTLALLFSTCLASLAHAQTVTTITNNGPSANRLDLVILGDGYTAPELAKYAADLDRFLANMFLQDPYLEYKAYFNIHRIDVISAESGVDHPETNTFKNTALDGTFNCVGIQRLVCVNNTKVLNVVSSLLLPSQRDIVLVIVNDPVYGGSGGAVAVSSTHPDAVEIVLHELGHSLGLLADEYGGPPPPECNASVEPPEVNVTRATDRAAIKWNYWIDSSTELPTLSTAPGIPGLYPGAKYCDTALYRPTYNSKMRSLFQPFEQINTEQLIKRYYNFASPIDSSTPTVTTITANKGITTTFSVKTPIPTRHSLDVDWLVDGERKSTGFSYLLDSSPLDLGDHSIVATVHDATDAVRSDPSGLLSETASWTLHIDPSKCDLNRDGRTNILDLQLIIRQLLGLVRPTSDVNGDGNVNVLDLRIVLDAILGRGCPN